MKIKEKNTTVNAHWVFNIAKFSENQSFVKV